MELLQHARFLVEQVGGILPKLVTDYGFTYHKMPNSSCFGIYVHAELGVVVKRAYIVGDGVHPLAIPTELVNSPTGKGQYDSTINKFGGWADTVLIQPFADTSRKVEAFEEIRELMRTIAVGSYYDVHDDNVAHYEGKAVVIDW